MSERSPLDLRRRHSCRARLHGLPAPRCTATSEAMRHLHCQLLCCCKVFGWGAHAAERFGKRHGGGAAASLASRRRARSISGLRDPAVTAPAVSAYSVDVVQ